MVHPDSGREWFSLDDDEGTWLFDLTFLTSGWSCIWGAGCPGIEPEPDTVAALGCCTHGAHFADDEDRHRVMRAVRRLEEGQWQLRPSDRRRSPVQRSDDGWTTRVVDGACIFLNRSGYPSPGCALHAAAERVGERPLDWKPEVCWQLPLRLEHHTDDSGGGVHTLREWRRRDWGEGGADFGWWCTEEPDAFAAAAPVYDTLADEIVHLVGVARYRAVVDYIESAVHRDGGSRETRVTLDHPALRGE